MTITHGPKHHPLQDKDSWYSSRNTSAHLQQVGIKSWVREGTQLDLPDITKNKVTPRIIVTPDFPKKTKHSLYVCPGSPHI
jgi:hypothetical protein